MLPRLAALGVIAVLLPDHFDGEIPAQVEVAPLEDRAHSAPCQFADQLVTRPLARELGRLGCRGPDHTSAF